MAIKEYQWYAYNQATNKDAVSNIQDLCAALEWMVLCTVPVGQQITVEGITQEAVYCFLVGQEAAVPGLDTLIENRQVIAGETDYNLVWPAPVWGNYSDLGHGYHGFTSSIGSNLGFVKLSDVDYSYPDLASFQQALEDGDIRPIRPKVYFDVYINGSNKPSYYVNWTGADELSPVTLQPEIWIAAEDLSPSDQPQFQEIITRDGIKVPNTNCWNVESAGSYSYGGSYSTTYLSVMEALMPESSAFKLIHWGFNGEPEYIRLYLRMNNGTEVGELQRVQLGIDGTYANTEITESGNGANYDTIVRFHLGEPDYILPEDDPDYPGGSDIDDEGPGRYDPDDPPPIEDFEDDEGQGFDGNAVLTRTYAVSSSTLQNIGQKLWTQSYFDVLKVQSNPIENIVSVKGLPMEFTGTQEEIKVGDIAFGINGDKVASVHKISIGSVKYTGYYGNYLDLGPYTKTKVNLPYIGLVEVDPADIFNSTLSVDYVIDLVTGQCMAILTIDGIPYMNVTGQMGFDIPITATDRVQTELRVASAAITAVGGAAGHLIGGDILGAGVGGASSALSLMGADYTSQRTASPSPACASFANHMVYLLIERPLYEGESEGYKHLHGYPCHKYMKLGSLSGFVAVDRRTDINIAMTSEENAMLEQLLTEGVYI